MLKRAFVLMLVLCIYHIKKNVTFNSVKRIFLEKTVMNTHTPTYAVIIYRQIHLKK